MRILWQKMRNFKGRKKERIIKQFHWSACCVSEFASWMCFYIEPKLEGLEHKVIQMRQRTKYQLPFKYCEQLWNDMKIHPYFLLYSSPCRLNSVARLRSSSSFCSRASCWGREPNLVHWDTSCSFYRFSVTATENYATLVFTTNLIPCAGTFETSQSPNVPQGQP